MKGGLRQSMSWLHTWSGLLLGWLLFVIFVSGTAAYFQEEITRWMQPEVTAEVSPEQAAQNAVAFLSRTAPNSPNWYVTLPGRRAIATTVYWQDPPNGPASSRPTEAILDGDGRAVASRASQGGYFLYRFHYDLHYLPVIWARYLVGVAAMAMLAAILSGIVTHKKIFTDFFTFRLRSGQRSWLDAHNMTAVLALPFFVMITYTGLVTLAAQYMPFPAAALYADPNAYYLDAFPGAPETARADRPASLAAMAPMFAAAGRAWDGATVGYMTVSNPGDANARVVLTRSSADRIGSRGETLAFDGVTGAQIRRDLGSRPAAETESVLIGIHAGRYARPALRWLYFLSGLGGAAMVATGLVLWTVKRRRKLPDPLRPHIGFRLVERLNIGAIAGFPAGVAAYLLANRLLPLRMGDRADWEINSLFIVWGAVLAWAAARPARRAWPEALGFAAALFALAPAVNALTTPRNLLVSIASGDWVFAGVDLTCLAMAAAFGFAAGRAAAQARKGASAPRRPPNRAVSA